MVGELSPKQDNYPSAIDPAKLPIFSNAHQIIFHNASLPLLCLMRVFILTEIDQPMGLASEMQPLTRDDHCWGNIWRLHSLVK